ncbi:MAG: hypothetical protein JNK15_10300, partial [Planctomycetes bacterium]|nr:hypothetical protein [Planctomycetota bacterium]
MNALLEAVDAIAVHFGVLVLGVTIVLAVGCVAVTFARRSGERRRLGGLCAGAVALYLAVAVVPLPRWAPDAVEPAPRTVAAASERIERLLAATADLVAVPDPADRVATPSSPDPTIAAAVPAPVPAVPAPIVAAAPWPWARLAVGSWLVLAAAMALRACVGFARLFRLLRASRPVADAELAGVEVPRGVRVRGVERAVRPFCAWCGRSVVVVPVSLLAPECRSQLRSVLRHELAHVRAGDPALQLLLTALA